MKKQKILKIIQIIYDVISVIFIGFVIVSLIIGNNKSDKGNSQHLTPNIQSPIRKNATITNNGNIYTFGTDIGSGVFLKGFLSYMEDEWAYTFTDVASMESGSFGFNGIKLGFVTNNSGINATNPSLSTPVSNVMGFNMSFSRTGMGTGYRVYNASLYPVLSNNTSVDSMKVNYQLIFYMDTSSDVITYEFSVINRAVSTPLYLIYTSDVGNNLIIKFMSGGDSGYNYAYKQGYDKGYIDGSRGMDSNVFVVIGQSFGAISSLFSIELLPGLPLWILIFTPLIVAVVIVVVKLIKG